MSETDSNIAETFKSMFTVTETCAFTLYFHIIAFTLYCCIIAAEHFFFFNRSIQQQLETTLSHLQFPHQ